MTTNDQLTNPPLQAVTQEMWDEAQRVRLFPGDRSTLRDAIGYALEHVKRGGGNVVNAQLTADRLKEMLKRLS